LGVELRLYLFRGRSTCLVRQLLLALPLGCIRPFSASLRSLSILNHPPNQLLIRTFLGLGCALAPLPLSLQLGP
jgi:hypothetical protein